MASRETDHHLTQMIIEEVAQTEVAEEAADLAVKEPSVVAEILNKEVTEEVAVVATEAASDVEMVIEEVVAEAVIEAAEVVAKMLAHSTRNSVHTGRRVASKSKLNKILIENLKSISKRLKLKPNNEKEASAELICFG